MRAAASVDLLSWYQRAAGVPWGRQLLDRVMWQVVPLNRTIQPQLVQLSQDAAEVRVRFRRALSNHLGSVHASVLFTAGEYVQAMVILANAGSLGAQLIVKAVTIEYLAKGRGDLRASAQMPHDVRGHVQQGLDRGENVEFQVTSLVVDNRTGRRLAVLKGTWKARRLRSG